MKWAGGKDGEGAQILITAPPPPFFSQELFVCDVTLVTPKRMKRTTETERKVGK